MAVRTSMMRDLRGIRADLLTLGREAEQALGLALTALVRRDLPLARAVIAGDLDIDRLRYQIEERCLEFIATQQPMAGDLREVVTSTSLASELERIADHAKGIARLALRLTDGPLPADLGGLPPLGDDVRRLLRESLQAYVDGDAARAKAVIKSDDPIDRRYQDIFQDLIAYMAADPSRQTSATYLIWVAHNLERIADRSTNIAERVLFMVTGKLGDERMNVEETD